MAAPGLGHSPSRRSDSSSDDQPSMVGPFKKLHNIGKGSFAMVYKGVHIKHNTLVAIKSVQLYKLNRKLRDNLTSEIKILRSLQHPHIVALIDCQETPNYMNIVMEFCGLGDLSNFIKKRDRLHENAATADMIRKYPNPPVGGLNEVVARHFTQQIASALEFLHSKNYIHRDLKPQNLLLNPSPEFYRNYKPSSMPFEPAENSLIPAAGIRSLPMLKVADFGFARFLPQTSLAETLCGSPLYMAPEILRYEKYDAKADLWSVGTVLYEMMFGKPPFRATNHVELLKKIEKQADHIKFGDEVVTSKQMRNIIRGLLKRRPTERMGFEEFFDHPLIRDDIPGLVGNDRPASVDTSNTEAERQSSPSEGLKQTSVSPRNTDDHRRESIDYTHAPPQAKLVVGSAPNTRPASKPSSFGQPTRRVSYTPTPEADQLARLRRESRPAMYTHQTAPARQLPQQQQDTPSAVAMERRQSRQSASPKSSVQKHLEAQRIPPGAEDIRERAEQDINFERDYVVVEKQRVEVNALADEVLAANRYHSNPQTAMVRHKTTQGSPTSTTGAHVLPSRAMHFAQGKQRPDPTHHRTGSYERRYARIPGSVSSAISNALNAVALRSGVQLSPPLVKGLSPPKGYTGFPVYPGVAQSSILLIGEGGRIDLKDEESRIILLVEELGNRSNVVYGFAEVKFKQLLPAPPSDQGLGIANNDKTREEEDDDDLTVDATMTISEEALVLYVKAVTILSKAIDLAAGWWARRNRSETEPRASPGNASTAAVRMTNVVQWLRTRFNECIDKAQLSAQKLMEAQKALPSEHRLHPSNRPSASGSSTSIGSTENIFLPSGITAEKLLYERAIEMSKAAAVNELVNQDLAGCEMNYATAIQMLLAILDTEEEGGKHTATPKKDQRQDEDASESIELEDKEAIKKLIDSMKVRLKTLRKKIEIAKAQKRASITGLGSIRPSTGSSPSTTPVGSATPR